MDNHNLELDGSADQPDVDAMCEQCGTVNATRSVYCKSCGANLHEQWQRRMAEQAAAGGGLGRIHVRNIITGVFTFLGIMVVLVLVFNLGAVEGWFTARIEQGIANRGAQPARFWQGKEAKDYSDLAQVVAERPLAPEETHAKPVPLEDGYDGRYCIQTSVPGSGIVNGIAAVVSDDETLYALAQFPSGVEIRAQLDVSEKGLIVKAGGVRLGDGYAPIYGYAEVRDDNTLLCIGQAVADTVRYRALAYRLP